MAIWRKTSRWFEENKERFWFSFIVNSIFCIVVTWISAPSFELNDDVIIGSFVDGTWGIKDAHLVFQNYILGVILKLLYTIGGTSISWYAVLQYFVLLIAFSVLCYVLIRRLESAQMLLVSGIILAYFGYESYVHIQFTKTAAIVVCSGLFLLFHTITQEKVSYKTYVGGLLLVIIGFCYRVFEAEACFALMLGIGIFLLCELKNVEERNRIHKLKVYFGTLFIVLMVMIGALLFDQMMYQTEEWQYYNEYNTTRSMLIDYGMPDYEKYEMEYQKLGIERSAYEMFLTWNFADPEIFSIETMKQIMEMKEEKVISERTIKEFIWFMGLGFFQVKAFYPLMLIGILWLFWCKHDAKALLALGYIGVVFVAFYFYLYHQGRFLENRVDVGLSFATSLVLIWMYTREKNNMSIKGSLMVCMCLFVWIQTRWCSEWRIIKKDSQEYANGWMCEIVEEISDDSENFYFAKVGALPFMSIQYMPEGLLNRVNWLGGWIINNPRYLDVMELNGITNPYRYMLENENVYLIDNDIELTMEYIQDYYDANATFQLIKQIGPYSIYKLFGK